MPSKGGPHWHRAIIAEYARLRSFPGVLSVSIGLKEVGRAVTARVCVKIYVEEKQAQPAATHRLPKTAIVLFELEDGLYVERRVPTDVVEVRGIKLVAQPFARLDPAPMGAEIGLPVGEGIRGTLGCWVTKPGLAPACFLTAGHVVRTGEGRVEPGQPVYQPQPSLQAPEARDLIGTTADGFVGNDLSSGGYLDYAAVVVPPGGRGAANRSPAPCIPLVREHLTVPQILVERTAVRKFGAKSGCTEGVLSAYHAHFADGTGRTFNAILEFTCVSPDGMIADHGDSGAMVVSRSRASDGAAVGLLFAVSHDHRRGFVVPFERLARLGFRISGA